MHALPSSSSNLLSSARRLTDCLHGTIAHTACLPATKSTAQDGSLRLYLCVMLHRAPLVCDAGEHIGALGRLGCGCGEEQARQAGALLAVSAPLCCSCRCVLSLHPCACRAVVMQLGGSRFFDCYIPALGCDVRIHTGGWGAVLACRLAQTLGLARLAGGSTPSVAERCMDALPDADASVGSPAPDALLRGGAAAVDASWQPEDK